MTVWQCNVCLFVYQDEIALDELPNEWVCPKCSSPKTDFVEGGITFPKDDPPRKKPEEYEAEIRSLKAEIIGLQDQLRGMFKPSTKELEAYVSEAKKLIITVSERFSSPHEYNLEELIRYFISYEIYYREIEKDFQRAIMNNEVSLRNVYEIFLTIREEFQRIITRGKELQREKENF